MSSVLQGLGTFVLLQICLRAHRDLMATAVVAAICVIAAALTSVVLKRQRRTLRSAPAI